MIDRPRTLLISPFFDAALPSGGVLYSVDVTREWLRRGRQVAVICAERDRPLGDLRPYAEDGALTLHPIISAEKVRFTHHPGGNVWQPTTNLIAEFSPDVIHVHNIHGAIPAIHAVSRASAPVILTALDFGLLCFNFYLYDGTNTPCGEVFSPGACAVCRRRDIRGAARWLGGALPRALTHAIWPDFVRLDQSKLAPQLHASMKHAMTSVDRFIAPSTIMAERLAAAGVPETRITSIVYGVASEKMVRPDKRPSDVLRLAYLGSAEPVKCLSVLLDAAEQLPDGLPLRIRAMGDDVVRQAIQPASSKVRRYVQHHPLLFGEALAKEHANIDAVLVPSLWHENSPFVVLESLATGTPVIASDQAGIRHLITPEKNGQLIEPGNPNAWAQALTEAAENPDRIRRMQLNATFTRTTADFVDDLERVEAGV